jgi:hypothetical protein
MCDIWEAKYGVKRNLMKNDSGDNMYLFIEKKIAPTNIKY